MNKIATFFRESMVARFLIPAGIFMIIFSIIMFVVMHNNKNYIETSAIVSRIELSQKAYTEQDGEHHDATYNVYVKYTVDEKEYEEYFGEFSNYKTGDKLTISYNPDDPTKISQPVSIIWPIAILLGGIAALVGGIVSAYKTIKKHQAMKLQEEGWKNGE